MSQLVNAEVNSGNGKRRDFCLVMAGISENVRSTSRHLQLFSEDFRTLTKMSKDIPTTFEHLRFEWTVDIGKFLRLL